MSAVFGKLGAKLLAIFAIVLFVVGFREMILTDEAVGTVFGELMGLLPFAGVITDALCKIMKYPYTVPLITASSVLTDLIRLACMALLQPLAVGILTSLFLRIPSSRTTYWDQEEYMDTFGYKVKEMGITVLSAPLLALAAAWFSEWLLTFFSDTFGEVGSILLGILSVGILGALSLIPLVMGGVALGTAIAWRIIITFASKMGTTFVTNAMCLWVYIALLGGVQGEIMTSILSLIIWLVIMDVMMQGLQRAVAR